MELLKQIVTDPVLASTYVILIAENWDSCDLVQVLECGASDFLTLPVQPSELVARLNVGRRLVELQTQLSMAQKLESIGQLAAGVAHEINTPVQYIGDNLQFLSESMDQLVDWIQQYEGLSKKVSSGTASADDLKSISQTRKKIDWDFLREELPQALSQSLHGVQHVARIVGAMKGYSHMGGQDFQMVDLREVVSNAVEVARNQWKYHSKVDVQFPEKWPLVPCFPGEMNQVFLNLLLNAAHAIEDVVKETGSKGLIRFEGVVDQDDVVIRISDTGRGIPKEIQSKVFDPFFTTKEVGKGTGQGLAMVHSIVGQHSGKVTFESQEGMGTTFYIRLPLYQEDAEEKSDNDLGVLGIGAEVSL